MTATCIDPENAVHHRCMVDFGGRPQRLCTVREDFAPTGVVGGCTAHTPGVEEAVAPGCSVQAA